MTRSRLYRKWLTALFACAVDRLAFSQVKLTKTNLSLFSRLLVLAGAVLVLLGGDDILDAQVDACHLKAGHRGQTLGDSARLNVVEDRRRIGARLMMTEMLTTTRLSSVTSTVALLGQVLGTKLLLHKAQEVTLHAQNVRHLAGGHGDDLLDHAVGE